jgi:hypothetical protein
MADPTGERIDKCLDALLRNVADIDMEAFWPVVLPLVEGCYTDLFSLEVDELLSAITNDAISNSHLASAFRFPSRFSNVLWNVLSGSKIAGIPTSERISLLDRVFEIWALTKHGSIFNEQGINQIFEPKALAAFMGTASWSRCADDVPEQRAIGQLNASLLAYAEATHYIYHKDSLEKHGPYPVSLNGQPLQLVIRDAYALRPIDLWSGSVDFAGAPYSAVTVAVLYDASIKIGFDIFDGMSTDSDLPPHAVQYQVCYVDGEGPSSLAVGTEAILSVCDVLEPLLTELTSKTEEMSLAERAKQHIRATWYTLEPLFRLTGQSWQSNKLREALQRVDGGCMKSEIPGGDLAAFRNFLDPRTELG